MIKEKIIKIIDRYIGVPVIISFAVFLVFASIIAFPTIVKYGFRQYLTWDMIVEAHGMLMDILIIGTFILWLNKLAERRLENRRYRDEIDDFKSWDEKEATYRIVGNIKRLNRNGITKINLSNCYLKNAELDGSQLQGSMLISTKLQGACFMRANLQRANFSGAKLQAANLIKSNLHQASLFFANLEAADFFDANLQGAYLRAAIGLTAEQLSKVKTLYQADLDPHLMEEIKEKYPYLLEKPEDETDKEIEGK